MTTQQQFIINALTQEFERINSNQVKKTKFNLIDSDSLQEVTRRKDEWEELSKKDFQAWVKSANEETMRIINLLREDLPNYVVVEKYNESIGKYELPMLQIRHESVHPRAHHESVVNIEVIIEKEHRCDLYGNVAYFGKGFSYKPNYNNKYSTIEEAVNDPAFKEALRKRVIR